MAAYAQFGNYNYPSASQLLVTGSGPISNANNTITTATAATTTGSAQSPLSGANAPSLSPSGGSATGVPLGALSPGSISQTSTNNAPPSVPGGQSSCCENGRPIMTDPVSGQTVCSCQYDSARLALSAGYSRIPSAGVGVYGTPYPSTDQNPYPSIGVDSSAFYSPLSNPYALKENGPTSDMSAWTSAGLQPTTGYYPYDPTLAAYGYGAGYDLAARRKNATRESTATLKAWLNEHKKNPYPTKGEKIMLAIITKMTLTQVSTWFANARRRLKKENKMTWEPKNKTDDDDDAMLSDDEKEKEDNLDHLHHQQPSHHLEKTRDHKESMHHVKSEKDEDEEDLVDDDGGGVVGGGGGGKSGDSGVSLMGGGMMGHHYQHGYNTHHSSYGGHPSHHHHQQMMLGGGGGSVYGHHHQQQLVKEEMGNTGMPKNQTSSDCGVPIPASKPKIWSLADTAACKTPPPLSHLVSHLQQHQQQQHNHHHHPSSEEHHHHQGWMGNNSFEGHHHTPQQAHHHPHQLVDLNSPDSLHLGQQHHHILTGPGTNSDTPPMNHHHHQQQNQYQQQQQSNFQVPPSQMSTTSSGPTSQYSNIAYGRSCGGFLGGPQQYSNNSSSSVLTGPPANQSSSPTTLHHHHTSTSFLQQQQQHSQTSSSATPPSMGFPEVQTDTPPQTPPNLKLPSVAGSLTTSNGTCYSSKGGYNSSSSSSDSPSPSSNSNVNYMANFTATRTTDQANNGQDSTVAFKPFFKSAQVGNVGFVPPV